MALFLPYVRQILEVFSASFARDYFSRFDLVILCGNSTISTPFTSVSFYPIGLDSWTVPKEPFNAYIFWCN